MIKSSLRAIALTAVALGAVTAASVAAAPQDHTKFPADRMAEMTAAIERLAK
jgi:hypothetical protein